MSASNENSKPVVPQEGALGKRAARAAEEAAKNKKFRRRAIIVILAIIVVVAAALVITRTTYFYTKTDAVSIGDTSYSPAELTYFYSTAASQTYQDLCDTYGEETAGTYMNLSVPLSQQSYFGSEEQTWADVVLSRAMSNMQNVTVFYDAAVSEGRTLSEDGLASVSESVSQLELYAGLYGVTTEKYLTNNFGRGMTPELYNKIMERVFLAEEYSNELLAGLTYSDDELAAYYAEHADQFNYLEYYAYAVNYAAKNFDGMDDKKTAAHEEAEKIAAARSAEEFTELVRAFTGEETTVNLSHNVAENITSAYQSWLADPARVKGDTTVIDTDSCSYVLMFDGVDANDYPYVDFRHILINAEQDENGVYTEEAMKAAKARCEELLAEWEADPTEDHFAEMANSYSEDAGSNTNGGLYSNVVKRQMVSGVNDFLFAEGRAVGDTAVVPGTSGAYSGYHLVYCSAVHENLCNVLARNAKTEEDFNEAFAALKGDNHEIVQGKGMKYVTIG